MSIKTQNGSAAAGRPVRPPEASLRLLGLDGVRAFAVAAVLAYHAGLGWAGGGFLGVEVFFVLSGFLITTLLVEEWYGAGRVALWKFWMRRARRLLPALFVVLTVTLAWWVAFRVEDVGGIRGDAAAAIGYVANWWFIAERQSYFETVGDPSPFGHLWSLAIEEQFYLLWPLLLIALLPRLGRRRLGAAAVLAALGFATLMAFLYEPGTDPSRVYYGTDTRATGLLLGCATALLWVWRKRGLEWATWLWSVLGRGLSVEWRSAWSHRAVQALGLVAAGGLVASCVLFRDYSSVLYPYGLLAVDLATLAIIVVSVGAGRGPLVRFLETTPMRWLGVRSYGVYLWHFPVYLVVMGGHGGGDPGVSSAGPNLGRVAPAVVITLVLSALSYRFVERPIRSGALSRAWAGLRAARGENRTRLRRGWATAGAASSIALVTLGLAVWSAPAPRPPAYLTTMKAVHTDEAESHRGRSGSPHPRPAPALGFAPGGVTAGITAGTAAGNVAKASERGSQPGEARHSVRPRSHGGPGTGSPKIPASAHRPVGVGADHCPGGVYAVGDSVMLGSVDALRDRIPWLETVDASVGMQPDQGVDYLRKRAKAGQLGCAVVVHLGTNGAITRDELSQIMAIAGGRDVVLVNDFAPRSWEAANNEALAETTKRRSNATLVDWNTFASRHKKLFYEDGIHPTPRGQEAYARLVHSALRPLLAKAR